MQEVAALDADLLAHEEHLKYRYAQFVQTKAAIEAAEGSLENFAKACPRRGLMHMPWSPSPAGALQLLRPVTPLCGALQGYERLGFVREGNAIVYREWCPAAAAAQLIGDFNNWSGAWMERDEFGVWKVVLPDGGALPAFPFCCGPCPTAPCALFHALS